MKAASMSGSNFMIQYLPIYLTDSARTWLNHLQKGAIKSWINLEREFCNHFGGGGGLTLSLTLPRTS